MQAVFVFKWKQKYWTYSIPVFSARGVCDSFDNARIT